jgi:hypothetical protein
VNGPEPLTVYGIVTTGLIWEFGQLEGNVFTRDTLSYSIAMPEQIFGILDHLFSACEAQLAGAPV